MLGTHGSFDWSVAAERSGGYVTDKVRLQATFLAGLRPPILLLLTRTRSAVGPPRAVCRAVLDQRVPRRCVTPGSSRPWAPAWGSLEPPRRDGENAQKTGKRRGGMGEIRPKTGEGGRERRDHLMRRDRHQLEACGAGGDIDLALVVVVTCRKYPSNMPKYRKRSVKSP